MSGVQCVSVVSVLLAAAIVLQWSCAPCEAAAGNVVFVSSSCPSALPHSCLNLDTLASHPEKYLKSNFTVEFLFGTHFLTKHFVLSDDRLHTITFMSNSSVEIQCESSFFSFVDIVDLTIRKLNFSGCGTVIKGSSPFYNAALQFTNVANLQMYDVHVYESAGPSVSAMDVFGISAIAQSTFANNKGAAPHIYVTYNSSLSQVKRTVLTISDSKFLNSHGGSLSILFNSEFSADIDITNISTSGSVSCGSSGGDVEILLTKADVNNPVQVTITHSRIEDSNCTGVYIAPYMFEEPKVYDGAVGNVRIHTSVISGHTQGAVLLLNPMSYQYKFGLAIEDSQITDNALQSSQDDLRQGAGLSVINDPWGLDEQGLLVLTNVSFERNNHTSVPLGTRPNTVYLTYAHNAAITDCRFLQNQGSGIVAYDSSLILSSTLAFTENSAYQGGALALYGGSYLVIENNTYIEFRGNYAGHNGGAVYTDSSERNEPLFLYKLLAQLPKCFLQLPDLRTESDLWSLNVTLNFTGNLARDGGDDIYGGLLDECSVSPETVYDATLGFQLLHTILVYNSSISSISSDPWRVCLCSDGVVDCTAVFMNSTVYPGEDLSLSAIVVGQRFGAVSGSIYANFLSQNETEATTELKESWQYSQEAGPGECTNLTYSILSNSSEVVLTLTATDATVMSYLDNETYGEALIDYYTTGMVSKDFLTFPVYINVTLLPCPLGFKRVGNPPGCVCDNSLTKADLSCDIDDHTVRRDGTVWVNASFHGGKSDGAIVHKNCPFRYCKPDHLKVDLAHPDKQCAFGRSGTLCGGCPPDESVSLGSSQCQRCSNVFLTLILPFALAGILLVLFIRLFNLTVATGTVNGLIFYANIVQANNAIFIPAGATNVLTVFISWLNLDLGIETCFFDGMTQYVKTWLQFVFPLYIWFIAIVIIFVSHYSSLAARILGNRSVPVLSTLFLLSYTKLLRTIIAVFSVTVIQYPDGSQTVVWAHDGNVEYLSWLHAPLFAVAVVFLLFLWLPYTCLLLTGQCLLRMNRPFAVTRLMIKLKPILDSYFGPFQDGHRYWVGALLMARSTLFLTFAFNSTNEPSINLLALSLVLMVVIMYTGIIGQVYRYRYLALLEVSFLFNAMILTLGAFYSELASGNQAALVYTSVGVAFLEFLAIVVIHGFLACRRRGYKEMVSKTQVEFYPESSTQSKESQHLQYRSSSVAPVFTNEFPFPAPLQQDTRLREPLLESN